MLELSGIFHWNLPAGQYLSQPWGQSRVMISTALLIDVSCQVTRSSDFWFLRRRFLKVFTIYGHDGHVTWTIITTVVHLSHGGCTCNFALIGHAVSKMKMF